METTLAERKLHTIELITKLEDDSMLDVIEQLLSEEAQEDWAHQLTDQEKADLQEGLNDLDAGRTEDYEDFMQRMQQKFQ
jgi:hypothetical protein